MKSNLENMDDNVHLKMTNAQLKIGVSHDYEVKLDTLQAQMYRSNCQTKNDFV